MSTRDSLNVLLRDGHVVHVAPLMRGIASVRHLFLEVEVYKKLESALEGNSQTDMALARLFSALDAFTSGRMISIGDHPFEKEKSAYMARTDPPQDGIFDFRVHGLKGIPSVRLFGAFCETNVFLGLTWKLRASLGGRDDRLFNNAILQAIGVWDRLMPECRRFYSENIEDHVSENFHVV